MLTTATFVMHEPIYCCCLSDQTTALQLFINSSFKFRSVSITEVIKCYKKLKNQLRSFEEQTGLAT
jgi:hypothetical protein